MTDLENINAIVADHQQELIELLCKLIRIPTINTGIMTTGNELEACHFLASLLKSEKIPFEIYPTAPGRANLVVMLKGKEGHPKMIWLSHLDVVPPGDTQLWTFPPFAATISHNTIYGRGASDCKGLVAAQVMALILLKRTGVELKGDLTLIASADEESGGKYGLEWLSKHEPTLLQADLALNEGGGQPFVFNGHLAYLLGIGEKGRFETSISIKGTGGHAALPWSSRNPSLIMAEVLKRLEKYQPEKSAYSPVFSRLKNLIDMDYSPPTADLDQIIKQLAKESPAIEKLLMSMTRLTITPTVIKSGIKSNVIPDSGSIICDIRALPHQGPDYINLELSRILSDLKGVDFNLECTAESSCSTVEPGFLHLIEASLNTLLSQENKKAFCLPSLTVGFTDSRFLRPFGTRVYNFSPLHPEGNTARLGAHKINECMEIDELIFKTRFFLDFALRFLSNY
ncbi:MAG: M20/M25/M40 family metallo-hydrolase [Candidatus Tectomicrobia bacterium]|uniref:M20/M25/M40 family metallo-hydrolase n=1 Tax=Tectimicrobiota bacterium TaxID=2528274 RepID=A0A933GLC4_UNCTE|nr:M20/M25/M40 family metallo-hydrolase [Candidatus Tectomicrobia bacterium]